MVARIGPLATKNCEPGQAWKGAAAAVNSCAGVWRIRAAANVTGYSHCSPDTVGFRDIPADSLRISGTPFPVTKFIPKQLTDLCVMAVFRTKPVK